MRIVIRPNCRTFCWLYSSGIELKNFSRVQRRRYSTIVNIWGWTTKCPRKPYTKFGPDIQRTCHAIRILSLPVYNSTHHCAMSYRASIRPNVVVPFHRWTTCGPRQLHTKFGPNIRTTSLPAEPLLLMFSYFTIQNFKLQFDPPFAVHSIK